MAFQRMVFVREERETTTDGFPEIAGSIFPGCSEAIGRRRPCCSEGMALVSQPSAFHPWFPSSQRPRLPTTPSPGASSQIRASFRQFKSRCQTNWQNPSQVRPFSSASHLRPWPANLRR
jgi:hypothetical protein